MTTRRKIWMMLFGAGAVKAQEVRLGDRMIGSKGEDYIYTLRGWEKTIGWKEGKAINNQCPVCGVMAEPYHRRPGPHLTITPNPPFDDGPVMKANREQIECLNCHVVFVREK